MSFPPLPQCTEIPESNPIRETSKLQPTNAYGESKLMVERMLSWFHRIHGLSYASLRYFNAAGATETLGEQHDPETYLIPMVLQVASGKRDHISIFGGDYDTPDGTCVRDYVHVSDLASAHLLALDALCSQAEPAQRIYNLGNGHGFSVREVIECARRVTGHPIPAGLEARRAEIPAILVASSAQNAPSLAGNRVFPSWRRSSAAPGNTSSVGPGIRNPASDPWTSKAVAQLQSTPCAGVPDRPSQEPRRPGRLRLNEPESGR